MSRLTVQDISLALKHALVVTLHEIISTSPMTINQSIILSGEYQHDFYAHTGKLMIDAASLVEPIITSAKERVETELGHRKTMLQKVRNCDVVELLEENKLRVGNNIVKTTHAPIYNAYKILIIYHRQLYDSALNQNAKTEQDFYDGLARTCSDENIKQTAVLLKQALEIIDEWTNY